MSYCRPNLRPTAQVSTFPSHNKFLPIRHVPNVSSMQKRSYSSENININLVNRKGETIVVKATHDDTLLDVIIDNDIDIESFGVCEGTLGCSTCHVILEKPIFELMDKVCPPTAEEYDMLDMACGLTETSRLGCQIEISKDLEGCTITIPREVSDAREL